MADVGNVLSNVYKVLFYFFHVFKVFFYFYLNVYYIYDLDILHIQWILITRARSCTSFRWTTLTVLVYKYQYVDLSTVSESIRIGGNWKRSEISNLRRE